MKSDAALRSLEIELKLSLPVADQASIESTLALISPLFRRKRAHIELHNIYFDTPEHVLRKKRVALRIRQIDIDATSRFLQTLKIGGDQHSALSQRGEWEVPATCSTLALSALADSPWTDIDPDGTVFPALVPLFATNFRRTNWSVRGRDASIVEVSLDVGQILVGDRTAPICEIEFELIAGQSSALFKIAQQIAHRIAVLPENRSKAERGYALAEDLVQTPVCSQPPPLTADVTRSKAAQQMLYEMFCQFTANLNLLRSSDDPEVVHQSRVGWRRFKGALRLFKPILAARPAPPLLPLQPLLICLGELRDLDVASTETLPPLTNAFSEGDATRLAKWQAMSQMLARAAILKRKSVRDALVVPVVGSTLLLITEWLEDLGSLASAREGDADVSVAMKKWARHRIVRLHDQLTAVHAADDVMPEHQHRVRILAKRLRYGIDALQPLLPKQSSQRWHKWATSLQSGIGSARDVLQAKTFVSELDVDLGIVEFMRGFSVGQQRSD